MIAILGGMGEIGFWLVRRLMQGGESPCVIHRGPVSPKLSRFQLNFRQADLNDAESVQRALKGCAVVVNCAVDKKGYGSDRQRMYKNINACKNLMHACVNNGVKRLIHLSSIAVLPPQVTASVVSQPFAYSNQKDWYTQVKIATEKIILNISQQLEVCVIRPGIVYGPYLMWSRVALQRCQDFRICLPNPKEAASRCYAVHASDLAALIHMSIIFEGQLPTLVYGVNPEDISWHDFYGRHAAAAGMHNRIETFAMCALRSHARAGKDPLSAEEVFRWIKASPLLDPVRSSKWFRNTSSWAKSFFFPKLSSCGENSECSLQNSAGHLWPTEMELQMYSSNGDFPVAETGGQFGFRYRVALIDGCKNVADFWGYRLHELPVHNADECYGLP